LLKTLKVAWLDSWQRTEIVGLRCWMRGLI
jgi:hypothetical protein